MVPEGSNRIKCEYCDSVFAIDDEASHVKFDDAKQAGYDFERGRIRAQKEEAARQHASSYRTTTEEHVYEEPQRTYEYNDQRTSKASKNWDPSMGAPTPDQKAWLVVKFVVTILFGVLGVHKFMDGRIGMGLLYLFTAGLFFIGVAYDLVMQFIQLVRMFSY